jgi:hypothetical protein
MIKKSLLVLSFLMGGFSLFGQTIFVEKIDITVDGKTKPRAIMRELELKEGREFSSEASLKNYLRLSKNELDDTRLFKFVELSYTFSSERDGKIPVLIQIVVEDSHNIIALPKPTYDSDDGFELSLRARNYNFMGSMEPLRLNFNYVFNEDSKHEFQFETNYVFNFIIKEQNFSLKVSQDINYEPDESYGDDFYMGSGLSLGTSYTLPWNIYDGNYPKYSLSTSVSKEYAFDGISEDKDEIVLGFSQGLTLGQPEWGNNNYREGFYYTLDNDWEYNIDSDMNSDEDLWTCTISGNSQYHKDLYPIGYSGRIGFEQNLFVDTTSNIDDDFRGIKDSEDREAGGYVYMNNALYLTVWNNQTFWELMGGPTLDIGYLWDADDGVDNLAWAVGVEGLCYPAAFKSFQARISIGLSGSGFMDSSGSTISKISDNLEVSFDLGKFF